MKKITTLALAALTAATILTGCTQKTAGTVSTDGSTSMEKVIGALGESFQEQNEGAAFTYNPTGSGSGIQAVQEGRCDIGLSSRELKEEETAQGLTATVLAYDGIAVIVNPENPVADLDTETIAKLYTGEIENWKDAGGNDAPVVLIGREAGSGTRDGFESITGTEEKCQYRQELTSTGDVITAVAQNPDAIGYASLASVKDSVRAITVNGVAPTEDTVKDGSYVIQRPFILVTKTDAKLSETAQAFFDFATSAEAAPLISGAGAVPAN
ncbi:phosphate ABC transporter substrate-binding protein [Acutalibacter intestini]|uniref:phosphate ABC transporter substrate-binding protein n=1 Tax=Acutalibacter intestini TaxID=3093659 RepID=UPI002AC925FB|nr:phosphate ABC transporter substrate-binding protein [Acutalibacter sp. M00204]